MQNLIEVFYPTELPPNVTWQLLTPIKSWLDGATRNSITDLISVQIASSSCPFFLVNFYKYLPLKMNKKKKMTRMLIALNCSCL